MGLSGLGRRFGSPPCARWLAAGIADGSIERHASKHSEVGLLNLTAERDEIKTLQDKGTKFSDIEDRIADLALSQEAKDALWLLAWSRIPEDDRWQIVTFTLGRPLHPRRRSHLPTLPAPC